ncbi:unnamed protein product [Amoebophrya sp. A120]|nr:unnamed protein product [Amoebophrya sp. A120]|eukprot:GSA120T00020552001.1
MRGKCNSWCLLLVVARVVVPVPGVVSRHLCLSF